ncbi:MAG: hydantoinase B/oxoprolinase family protein, partial [Ferrovibrio sp.]
RDGRRWVMFSFFGGGHGGHPIGDGLNHGNAPISMATIPPLEILEAAYPVMFTEWGLRPDSGGAGRHRGGLGAVYEIELLEEEADLFLFGERGKFAPAGVLGGHAAQRNRFFYPKDGKSSEPAMVSKLHDAKLKKGDRIRLETPGGGGYGPPSERKAESIAEDLRLGYVTEAGVARDYGRGKEAAE